MVRFHPLEQRCYFARLVGSNDAVARIDALRDFSCTLAHLHPVRDGEPDVFDDAFDLLFELTKPALIADVIDMNLLPRFGFQSARSIGLVTDLDDLARRIACR